MTLHLFGSSKSVSKERGEAVAFFLFDEKVRQRMKRHFVISPPAEDETLLSSFQSALCRCTSKEEYEKWLKDERSRFFLSCCFSPQSLQVFSCPFGFFLVLPSSFVLFSLFLSSRSSHVCFSCLVLSQLFLDNFSLNFCLSPSPSLAPCLSLQVFSWPFGFFLVLPSSFVLFSLFLSSCSLLFSCSLSIVSRQLVPQFLSLSLSRRPRQTPMRVLGGFRQHWLGYFLTPFLHFVFGARQNPAGTSQNPPVAVGDVVSFFCSCSFSLFLFVCLFSFSLFSLSGRPSVGLIIPLFQTEPVQNPPELTAVGEVLSLCLFLLSLLFSLSERPRQSYTGPTGGCKKKCPPLFLFLDPSEPTVLSLFVLDSSTLCVFSLSLSERPRQTCYWFRSGSRHLLGMRVIGDVSDDAVIPILSFDFIFEPVENPARSAVGDVVERLSFLFVLFLFPPLFWFSLSLWKTPSNPFCGSHDWSVGGRDAEWHVDRVLVFKNLLFLNLSDHQNPSGLRLLYNVSNKTKNDWVFLARGN